MLEYFLFSEGLRVVAMQCYVAVEFVIGSIRNGDGKVLY